MSSDYISRLRGELLRAGAASSPRRRWTPAVRHLRPLALAATVALVVAAVVIALPDTGDERVAPANESVRLEYRLLPGGSGEAADAARIMAARLEAAGVEGADVTPSGDGVAITLPAAARADADALTQRGEFAIYDWERSVLGPDGRPAPEDASVTGGADTARGASVTRREAEKRLSGREGGRVVRGEDGGWIALGGTPALTRAEIDRATPGTDPMTKEQVVMLAFTPSGQTAFTVLTRELAQRGMERIPQGPPSWQHMAMVVDDRIVSTPYINGQDAPDGIDGATGAQIVSNLTPDAARRLAAILSAGPLPAALVPA